MNYQQAKKRAKEALQASQSTKVRVRNQLSKELLQELSDRFEGMLGETAKEVLKLWD